MLSQLLKSLILVCLISYSSPNHLGLDTTTTTPITTTEKSECSALPELYLCAQNKNQGAPVANYFYKQHNKQIYQKAFILQSGTVGTKSFYQTQNKEFAIWWCPTNSTYGAGFWNLDYSENLKNNSPCRGKVISESRTRCPWRTRSNSIDSIPWRYYETCSEETYDAGVSLYTCSSAFALSHSIITVAIALAAFISVS